jgi:hypothetical protein
LAPEYLSFYQTVLTQEPHHRVNTKGCKFDVLSRDLRVPCKPAHFDDLSRISIRGLQHLLPELLNIQIRQAKPIGCDVKKSFGIGRGQQLEMNSFIWMPKQPAESTERNRVASGSEQYYSGNEESPL